MKYKKKLCNINVYDAAKQRLYYTFNKFEKVYLSFSGGKDSGVLLNLALEVARELNKLPLNVLFIDLEAQYEHTITYATSMLDTPDINSYWICLPLKLRNAVSQIRPYWICWDSEKKEAWCRDIPKIKGVISDIQYFPFFKKGMEFEDFIIKFGEWFTRDDQTACLVGIRSQESLNRFRTLINKSKTTFENHRWTTLVKACKSNRLFNIYPIYDWKTEDVWIANGKQGYSYNPIYDLMNSAGVGIHQQRLCQPYGDDQRKGLYLFKILEPQTWIKIVNRVEGANFGNRYSENDLHTLGNFRINLPEGHTYKSYMKFLLNSLPPYLAKHYRTKIFKFLHYWMRNDKDRLKDLGLDLTKGFPDSFDAKIEAQRKVATYRRICKVILKNDYWCKGLGFSQTKRDFEQKEEVIRRYIEL